MDVTIVGVLGDLPGRALLFKMITSFAKSYRPCHVCTTNRKNLRGKNSILRDTESTKESGLKLWRTYLRTIFPFKNIMIPGW
jgi:hypothetical protein